MGLVLCTILKEQIHKFCYIYFSFGALFDKICWININNMGATPKHKRSKSKRNSARASDRFDKLLTKFKKVKKQGGSVINATKAGIHPSHRVSELETSYKGRKVTLKK